MSSNNKFKEVVNGILGKLSGEAKKRFYEEMRTELAMGRGETLAISESLKKIGIAEPMKVDLKKEIFWLYESKKKVGM